MKYTIYRPFVDRFNHTHDVNVAIIAEHSKPKATTNRIISSIPCCIVLGESAPFDRIIRLCDKCNHAMRIEARLELPEECKNNTCNHVARER